MPFTSLSTRLSGMPKVLAGPILRRVTATKVTVWIVLRESISAVKLTVTDDHNKPLMSGTSSTVAIGTALHMVAVTAVPLPGVTGLTEGSVYQYNFDFGSGTDLAAATNQADLAYAPYSLPSFCLPPSDIKSVRIMHGSCRMPHGEGPDALALLDPLIKQAASNAVARPHQLLLMGDQIYADDVAPSLLIMLSDASDVLLGWKELLPTPSHWQDITTASQASPFMRREMLRHSGFTSADLDSHLMSLGEYICMYLFVWSDVLWKVDTIPTFTDVILNLRKNLGVEHVPVGVLPPGSPIEEDLKPLTLFRSTLSAVRKVLANIPTSMICDDHEVTDDWNMTLDFCQGVYGNDLGLRIIQNGVTAYALCQHWGNVPEHFDNVTPAPAGLRLLQKLDKGTAASYKTNSADIQRIVAVHDWNTQTKHADQGVFHDSDALVYNYTIEATTYQIVVTDSRTWRSYPNGNNQPCHLIPKDQLKIQIPDSPATGQRALLVVITTNAPEIEGLREATRQPWLAQHGSSIAQGDPDPDIFDSWDVPAASFDRLVKRCTDKLPKDSAGKLHGQVILLSGDVHHSFATRLKYRADKRFEDTQAQPATVVFAQLVASSFRKQTHRTVDIHRDGYKWTIPGLGGPPPLPEGYVGFNLPKGTTIGKIEIPVTTAHTAFVPLEMTDVPTILLAGRSLNYSFLPNPKGIQLTERPAYRYRLDYLTATTDGSLPANPPSIPPIGTNASATERKQAAANFNKATGYYRQAYNGGQLSKQQIIGVNNLGEITFTNWNPSDFRSVEHTLRWQNPDTSQMTWTTYSVNLDPTDDAAYPDIKASVEPTP